MTDTDVQILALDGWHRARGARMVPFAGYSMLLDENGGIVDDLMATRRGDHFYVVVNGATKIGDIEEFERRLPRGTVIDYMKEQALLALQGPKAVEVLEALAPGVR